MSENLKSKEEISEEPNRYIYRDNSTADRVIVFECIAKDILEADKMYQENSGNDPKKQNHIGCSIEKADPESEKAWRSF